MRYAGLSKNDFSAAPGVCVTFYTQGCPHKCAGCQNPETWDFMGGMEFTTKVLNDIISALTANNIKRSLCIMGGEPLCQENQFLTLLILTEIKSRLPETKVYIWTGYTIEELNKMTTGKIPQILEMTDCLIDGPYIQEQRNITLPMRGSTNQRILYKNIDF